MIENRVDRRRRTYLGGRITGEGRPSAVDCLVRNLSPWGARIVLQDAAELPETFDIEIHKQPEARRARIVWRTAAALGICFSDDEPSEEDRRVLAERIAAICNRSTRTSTPLASGCHAARPVAVAVLAHAAMVDVDPVR